MAHDNPSIDLTHEVTPEALLTLDGKYVCPIDVIGVRSIPNPDQLDEASPSFALLYITDKFGGIHEFVVCVECIEGAIDSFSQALAAIRALR